MPKKFKLISYKCLACGAPMAADNTGYYTCSGCGAQFCPPEESERQARKVLLDCARNEYVSRGLMHPKSKTCGSKSSNGSKVDKSNKPSTKQLYDRLAASSNKIRLNPDWPG